LRNRRSGPLHRAWVPLVGFSSISLSSSRRHRSALLDGGRLNRPAPRRVNSLQSCKGPSNYVRNQIQTNDERLTWISTKRQSSQSSAWVVHRNALHRCGPGVYEPNCHETLAAQPALRGPVLGSERFWSPRIRSPVDEVRAVRRDSAAALTPVQSPGSWQQLRA